MDWSDIGQVAVHHVNQFASNIGQAVGPNLVPEGIYLAFALATPPIILGTPEQIDEQIRALDGKIKAKPVAHIVMTRELAEELIRVIRIATDQFDVRVGPRPGRP